MKKLKLNFSNVGTDWVSQSIEKLPARFIITRARAEIQQGPATQVALSVREKDPSVITTLDIALEYSLTVNPLDYLEEIEVYPLKLDTTETPGKCWISIRTNNPSGSEVAVSLEIKPL